MAKLDGEELKKFNKLLDELNKKKDKLGQDKLLNLDGTVENLDIVNQLLDVANENLADLNQSVEGIRETWSSVVGELKKVDNLTGVSVKSFNKLSNIANQLSNSQKGLNELSSRQITSLITKTKIEAENLKFQEKQLLAKGRSNDLAQKALDALNSSIEINKKDLSLLTKKTEGYEKIKKEIQDQIKNEENKIKVIKEEAAALVEIQGVLDKNGGLLQQQVNTLKTQEKYTKNVEKATGLTGLAMKGISGFLGKIGMSNMGGVFEDAAEAAKATASRLTDGGKKAGGFITKIRTMGSAFKVVGKAILKNLTDPLFLAGMAMKAMKGIFSFFSDAYKKGEEAAKVISDENTGMARSLGLAQGAASRLAGSVAGMGPTTAASKASIEGIYKAMGSTEKLSNNTLKVFVKLNTFAGMSAESLAKFQKFAKKGGEDAGTMVKNMANTALHAVKNNKLALSQKELLEETANQSSYVKLQFAGQGPALVKAVAQSRALGVNMEKAKNMARSLLNFEDSIAAEMEAELLTGKQLNLEEARALALKGDNVGAAKLIAEQVGGAAEFMSMNVLQQEALAKAAGMGVEEMTDMLSGQQDMKKTGADLVKDQTNGLKAMSSEVSIRESAENRARRAAEANIAVYKELAPLIHTLEETWTKIKGIILKSISTNVIKPMVEFINSKEGKEFLKELPGRIQKAVDGIVKFGKEVKKFATDNPTLMKVLAGLVGGVSVLKVTGLDKTLVSGAKTLFSGLMGDKSAVKSDLGLELGTVSNPMQVEMANSMNVGDLIGSKGKAGFMKQITTLFKSPKVMFRALRMKGGLFGKALGKMALGLGKLGPMFKTFGSSLLKSGGKLLKWFDPKAPGALQSLWKGAKSLGSKAFSGAKSLGSKAFSGVKSLGSSAIGGIKKGASAVGGLVKKGASAVGGFVSKVNPIKALKDGLLKNAGKWIGKAFKGGLLGALLSFGNIASILGGKGTSTDKAKLLVPTGASIIGSTIGSLIGSLLPGPGTLLGGIAGGLLGDWIGSMPSVQKMLVPPVAKALEGNDVAEDFIMQGGKIQKFRKDDIVMGGTKLTGGGADSAKTLQLLERLVNAVEKGGTVTLDGQKVGKALVAGSYRMQ